MKKRMLHRICAALPALLLLLLTACAEQPQAKQPEQSTENTTVSSRVETSISTTPIQPAASDAVQPMPEEPIPDGYTVVETADVQDGKFFLLHWITSSDEHDICHAVARRSADGRLDICLIRGGFRIWRIGEDGCTVALLRQDSTWTPPTFPQCVTISFSENGVQWDEAVYYAPLAEDSWYIYSNQPDVSRPDWAENHEAVELTNLFDGVGILLQRPAGSIGAGDARVQTGVTVDYDEAAHTMTVNIADTSGKLAEDAVKDLRNGYVERVELVQTGDSVQLILHLTPKAVGYALAETECLTDAGDEPATLISIHFRQTAVTLF